MQQRPEENDAPVATSSRFQADRASNSSDDSSDAGPTRAQKFLSFIRKWGLPIAVGTIVFSACVAAFFFPAVAMLLAPVLTPAIELIVSVIPASVSSLTAGFVAFGIVTVAATAAATAVTRLAMKGASKLYDIVASCCSKDDSSDTPDDELEAHNLQRRHVQPELKKDAAEPSCFGRLFSKHAQEEQRHDLGNTVQAKV